MLINEKIQRFACFRLQSSAQARILEKALVSQEGVIGASVNFSAEKAFVYFNSEETCIENIITAAKKYGVSFVAENEATQDVISRRRESELSAVKRNLILCLILAFPLLITMFLKWFDIDMGIVGYLNKPVIQLILATPIVFFLSFRYIVNVIRAPLSFSTLVLLGSLGAYFLSVYYGFFEKDTYRLYFDTAAIILIVAYFAKYCEMRTKIKISDELTELMGESAVTVTKIFDDNTEKKINIEDIREGDILKVQNGERIAADGVIISGISSIDESAITGDNFPVDKKAGDEIFAGTVNIANPITVSVNSVGEKTEFAKSVRMVEELQTAKIQEMLRIEKISQVFVAAILTLVLIVSFVNLLMDKSTVDIILIGIGILVIACPCALGLAFSMSAMLTSRIGIKYGILFRDNEVFEYLENLKALVVEKLAVTSGRVSINKLIPLDSYNLKALNNILYSLSSKSRHPVIRAINEYCKSQGSSILKCGSFSEDFGGVKAEINGSNYTLGTYEYCEKSGEITESVKSECLRYESNGEMFYFVMKDGETIAVILFSETINKTARHAILSLRESGVQVYMLAVGADKPLSKFSVSLDIEQSKIITELNYGEKINELLSLLNNENMPAMVGKGLKPSLAMANSPLAISLGNIEPAADVSNIAIKNDDLLNVVRSLEISKKTKQITNQNIILACVFNIIGIPFAVFGVIDPAIASLAMVISSICVLTNSYRIENYKFDLR